QRSRLRIPCQAQIEGRISLQPCPPIAHGVTFKARRGQDHSALRQDALDLGLQPAVAAVIGVRRRGCEHRLSSFRPQAPSASSRLWVSRAGNLVRATALPVSLAIGGPQDGSAVVLDIYTLFLMALAYYV